MCLVSEIGVFSFALVRARERLRRFRSWWQVRMGVGVEARAAIQILIVIDFRPPAFASKQRRLLGAP